MPPLLATAKSSPDSAGSCPIPPDPAGFVCHDTHNRRHHGEKRHTIARHNRLRIPRHAQPTEPQQETGGPSRDMMDCVCRNIRNRPRHNKNRRIIATIDDLRMSRHTQPAEPQQELGNHHEIWQVVHALTHATCHTTLSGPATQRFRRSTTRTRLPLPVPTIRPSASGYEPGYGWRHSASPAQGRAWRTHGRDC
ncbi:hypothetical protein DSM100238_0637 [Bifidobacterium apri]|uniref:Uncharacterized protein n=1 Tax=Bifidobacterium apri TaxID=1769423 RepID=A0A6A2VYI4_9BIFI|nr:hypothetical protein DSM100238_0637 [Bifidobacterium apri]